MDLVSELIVRRRLWTAQAGSLKTISSVVRNCRSRMLVCLDRLHEAGLGRENRAPPLDARVDLPGQLRRLGELADDLVVLAETAQEAALPLADHVDGTRHSAPGSTPTSGGSSYSLARRLEAATPTGRDCRIPKSKSTRCWTAPAPSGTSPAKLD